MTKPPAGAAAAAVPEPVSLTGAATLENRFLLSSVAFLRAKQLGSGARPRVEREGHNVTYLALLEVLADTVSWSIEDPRAATPAPGTSTT